MFYAYSKPNTCKWFISAISVFMFKLVQVNSYRLILHLVHVHKPINSGLVSYYLHFEVMWKKIFTEKRLYIIPQNREHIDQWNNEYAPLYTRIGMKQFSYKGYYLNANFEILK